jgi:cytidine deaminase
MGLSNALAVSLSLNPFHADAAIRARLEGLEASAGATVRAAIAGGLERTRRDVAANTGGILLRADADAIRGQHGLTVEELMVLGRPVAEGYSRPPISDFHVGCVGLEAGTGNLIFGGNLEFVGAHIGNTVHGEGFVFARAFSRGTAVETICLGQAHPCAHCRQFLSEFAATSRLTLIDPLGHRLTMAQLYPWPFDPGYLGERGIVAGQIRHPDLKLEPADVAPNVAARLTELGRRSYTPYGKAPAAIALTLSEGTVIGGAAIESVSFNPTMSPLQAAMIDLFAHGYAAGDIAAAAIATARDAQVDYARHAADALAIIAPGVTPKMLWWAR